MLKLIKQWWSREGRFEKNGPSTKPAKPLEQVLKPGTEVRPPYRIVGRRIVKDPKRPEFDLSKDVNDTDRQLKELSDMLRNMRK